jgi:hypothetical protein
MGQLQHQYALVMVADQPGHRLFQEGEVRQPPRVRLVGFAPWHPLHAGGVDEEDRDGACQAVWYFRTQRLIVASSTGTMRSCLSSSTWQ